MQVDGEDEDEDYPEPEGRHREGDEEPHAGHLVEDPALSQSRVDAHRDRDHRREQGGVDDEEERRRQPLGDHGRRRLLVVDRVTEAAVEEVPHEEAVLIPERPVEAERPPELGARLRCVVLAEDLPGGVARNQSQQEERDHGDAEQDRDHLEDPVAEKAVAPHVRERAAGASSRPPFPCLF